MTGQSQNTNSLKMLCREFMVRAEKRVFSQKPFFLGGCFIVVFLGNAWKRKKQQKMEFFCLKK